MKRKHPSHEKSTPPAPLLPFLAGELGENHEDEGRHSWGPEVVEGVERVRVAICVVCGMLRERGRARAGSGRWGWTRYRHGLAWVDRAPACRRPGR